MATVLVTGANRGIGLALARVYLERGDKVVGTARIPSEATALAALGRGSDKLTVVVAEVKDEASLAAAAGALVPRPLDIVICNAGVMSDRGGLRDPGHDAAEWQRVLMANVARFFLTARAFLPALERSGAGKLALISSHMGSSSRAAGKTLAYRASKAAATNIGVNLALELKPAGIAVGIFHPGWVATDLGGASAPVSARDSAKALAERIDRLSTATTGVFEDYLGQHVPF